MKQGHLALSWSRDEGVMIFVQYLGLRRSIEGKCNRIAAFGGF
jgi:hypothetical protein